MYKYVSSVLFFQVTFYLPCSTVVRTCLTISTTTFIHKKFFLGAPTITHTTLPQPSAEYQEFDTASFECHTQGYPRPTIQWLNDGIVMTENITETAASNATGVWVVNSKIDLVLARTFRGKLECVTSNGITPNDNSFTNIYMDCECLPITLLSPCTGKSLAFTGLLNLLDPPS